MTTASSPSSSEVPDAGGGRRPSAAQRDHAALGSIDDVEIDAWKPSSTPATPRAVQRWPDQLPDDPTIARLLGDGRDAQSAAERLVERAMRPADNITVVVIDVRALSS
jgi:hypothetical protein